MPRVVPFGDWKEREANTFEPAEKGIYLCEITKITPGLSKENKLPMLSFEFVIVEGLKAAGKRLFAHLTASKGKRWKLEQLFEALGVLDTIFQSENLDLDTIEGQYIKVACDIELYQGRQVNRVTAFYPVESNEEQKAELAQGMKKPAPEKEVDHTVPDPWAAASEIEEGTPFSE